MVSKALFLVGALWFLMGFIPGTDGSRVIERMIAGIGIMVAGSGIWLLFGKDQK